MKKSKNYPYEVTVRNSTVRVACESDGGEPKYRVRWYEGPGRKAKTFDDPLEADTFAKSQAQLLNDLAIEYSAEDIKKMADDRAFYRRLEAKLEPYGVGLDEGISELVTLLRNYSRDGFGYVNHVMGPRIARMKPRTVRETIVPYVDFLSKLENSGAQHLENTKATLNKFADQFGYREIHNVATMDIHKWLEVNWENGSTRDKHIYIIKGLFEHARDYLKALPQDVRTEAEYLVRKLHKKPEAEVFTVEEIIKLLSELQDLETIFAVVLVLFGHMRQEEVVKTSPRNYSLVHKMIYLTDVKCRRHEAKPRQIPMSPNLYTLLEILLPQAEAASNGGLIFGKGVFDRVREIAKAAGIGWKHNALRHCCSSYAVRAGKTHEEAAELSGHTVEVLKKNYLVPVAESDARRYWEISVDLERLKALPWRSRSYLKNLRSRLAEKKAASKQLNLFEL